MVSEKAELAKAVQKMSISLLENPLGPPEGVRGLKSLGCTCKFSIRGGTSSYCLIGKVRE